MAGAEVYNLTYEEAKLRASKLSNIQYDLILNLQRGETYYGKCVVSFDCSEITSELWLDYLGTTVTELKINSQRVEASHVKGHLYLPNLQQGSNKVEVRFENKYAIDGCGLHRFKDSEDGEEYLYTQYEPFYAHRAFPCFDQPDLKGTLQLITKTSSDWKVICNEPVVEVKEYNPQEFTDLVFHAGYHSQVVRVFNRTSKISTYLYAICAGPYEEFRHDDNEVSIPLGLYCRKTLKKYVVPERYFTWTVAGFKFYQNFFGINYPFTKYDQIFVPEFNSGAMENVGCVTYRDQYVFKDPPSQVQLARVCDTFLHEMAHMWFGDLVTMKWWDDLWLNESFATFMSHLCTDKALGDMFPMVWMEFLSGKGWGYATDQLSTTHPIHTHVNDTGETETNFDGISYSKGSAVLKQLYFLVGHDCFQAALQKYMQEFKFSNAVFDDLIRFLDSEVRERGLDIDLNEWAESWVNTSGLNELSPHIYLDSEGKVSSLVIKQAPALQAHPTLRKHKIIIEVFDSDLISLRKEAVMIQNTEYTELHQFNGLKVSCVILNVSDWGYCKVVLDDLSLNTLKRHLSKLPEGLTRQLVWRSLFDMVRDIKISGVEFLESAIHLLPLEQDSNIVNYVLEISSAALYNYVPEGHNKERLAQQLLNIVIDKIRSAPSVQDSVVFQKRVVMYLYHHDDINTAVTWVLNDDTGIEGFKLGQLDRWDIIKKYAAISTDAKSVVDKELLRDKSDTGKLAKLFCEAAYPDAESKHNLWNRYVASGETFSRYERDSSMNGFNRPRQRQLLHGYLEQYFGIALEIITSKDREYSKDFCENLLPRFVDEADVIRRLEELIPNIPEERYDIARMYREELDYLKKFRDGKELSREYISRTHAHKA
jgi:aminopeptidase N